MNSRLALPHSLRIPCLLAPIVLCALSISGHKLHAQTAPTAAQPNAILDHLNAIIGWYRHVTSGVQYAGQPSDAVYQANARTMAGQAVQQALQAARAQVALLPSGQGTSGTSPGSNSNASTQRIRQTKSDVEARISGLQSQLNALDAQIAKAPRGRLNDLNAQRDAVKGDLDLNNAVLGVLKQIGESVETAADNSQAGLSSSITQLERSVPELSTVNQASNKPPTQAPATSASQGLFGEAATLYGQLQSMHDINQLMGETDSIRGQVTALRTPLQATLRATMQQGQTMASQLSQAPPTNSSAHGAPPAPPAVTREQFDALTARFKLIAAAELPLRQEAALLDQSHSNFLEWRDSISKEASRRLRSLLVRIISIAVALGIILLLSEMWRRVTFRYVRDLRRRRQFLLIRRLVVGFCMGMVLILGIVSEFSSLATFAGFITAGLAVGLQTILLSVAAYFFLVGKWGIRVGDRISIAGVTGDVVDVGLVRLYLLELAGTGIELYPTGRVVVFANSVLFQATTPLFKQLPGTQYVWHEIVVPLKPAVNYNPLEDQLLNIVNSVYLRYRDDLLRQHGDVERRIEFQLRMPEPRAQILYSDSGLEYVVRYPVGLEHEAEVDGEVTRKLLELDATPELKALVDGLPKIRAAVKG